MTLDIRHAGQTDRGLVREENQDNWSAEPIEGVYVVSDGLGGEFAGATASKIVAEALPAMIRQRLQDTDGPTDAEAADLLKAVLCDLSVQVHEQTHDQPGLEGMGATVVVLWVRGTGAVIAHMGDSRAYLVRDGRMEQLTNDHSIVQLLIDQGEISEDQAAEHPARGQVTRSVGMEGEPLPEATLVSMRASDRFLLCTDGLTGMLTDESICEVLAGETEAERSCRRLIEAGTRAGGRDNMTALIVDVSCEAAATGCCDREGKDADAPIG